jgi:hypothetical protein
MDEALPTQLAIVEVFEAVWETRSAHAILSVEEENQSHSEPHGVRKSPFTCYECPRPTWVYDRIWEK